MNVAEIRRATDFYNCYDPTVHLIPEGWSGTVVEFLNLEYLPLSYRLFVVLYGDFIDSKTCQLLSVWSIRESSPLSENQAAACDVIERLVNGLVTEREVEEVHKQPMNCWSDVGEACSMITSRYSTGYAACHTTKIAGASAQFRKLMSMLEGYSE